jgi:cytochrome oxidase Cu insertion factor (SCO1/SenC/PrrC family)
MKMAKAQRALNRSSEGKQFIQFQTVFVTVNPEADTEQELSQFAKLFGP